MTFQDTWDKASKEGINEDNEAPPDGAYEVALTGAAAFTSKKGEQVVKLELQVVSAMDTGHEWTVIQGFKNQKQASVTKATCYKLGVDVDTVASLEELDSELAQLIGNYYSVDVARKGDFANTYFNQKTATAEESEAKPEPAPVATGGADDDDVPF